MRPRAWSASSRRSGDWFSSGGSISWMRVTRSIRTWTSFSAIGAKPGHGGRSGGPDPRSDVLVERLDECVAHHLEPAAQIIPDRDAEFVAGLGEAQESITAVAADIAARPARPPGPDSRGACPRTHGRRTSTTAI